MKCEGCGRTGHPVRKCFRRLACELCGKYGHTKDKCFYDPNNRHLRPPGWHESTCYNCGKIGHKADSFPARHDMQQENRFENYKVKEKADLVLTTLENKKEDKNNLPANLWVEDTGASHHVNERDDEREGMQP